MTETQREEIVRTIKECIHADHKTNVGPIVENPNPNEPGIWVLVTGQRGYLGASYQAALKTSQLSDWWISNRDGELTTDDRKWFETRATLGENWEKAELPIFREERRLRLAQNIQLATRDEIDRDWGN